MKYSIVNKEKYFVKNETAGTFTILMHDTGVQFYINQTGKLILDLLEKHQNTEAVLQELSALFPDINIKVLQSDFDDLFDLMVLYDLIIIEEKDKEAEYTETPYIRFAGDGDYRKLTRFIKNEKLQNKLSFHCINNAKELTPVSLRYTTFHGISHFCIAYDENSEILATMIITPPSRLSSVISLEGFIFSKKLKEAEIKDIVQRMIKVINRRYNDKLTKIRFSVFSDFKYINILEFLKELGFEKEAELQYESNDKSLIMHSKLLIKNK